MITAQDIIDYAARANITLKRCGTSYPNLCATETLAHKFGIECMFVNAPIAEQLGVSPIDVFNLEAGFEGWSDHGDVDINNPYYQIGQEVARVAGY